jgi:hypothetical protein
MKPGCMAGVKVVNPFTAGHCFYNGRRPDLPASARRRMQSSAGITGFALYLYSQRYIGAAAIRACSRKHFAYNIFIYEKMRLTIAALYFQYWQLAYRFKPEYFLQPYQFVYCFDFHPPSPCWLFNPYFRLL